MADNKAISLRLQNAPIQQEEKTIRNLIYVVRGVQVMLDRDLATLYQVQTKRLNEAAKRNIARFPEHYRFQLKNDEYDNLKSQFAASSFDSDSESHGGRRKLPYVYTEQGIAMLSAVLRSDVAVNASIHIMDTFVEMRRFLANNSLLFERISHIELKQLEYQKQTDEKLEQIFEYISEHTESQQKVFFDGQIYDAFSLIITLIQKANQKIVLIDGYVDVATLNLLAKKKAGTDVICYTLPSAGITKKDIAVFNAQYPSLVVMLTTIFHDRFLILDDTICYHFGASLKDAGKKCFAINLLEDSDTISALLQKANSTSTPK